MNKWIRRYTLYATFSELLAGAAFAQGGKFLFGTHTTNKVAPVIAFDDASGNPLTLVNFKGKYVLLNVWAIW